MVKVEIHNFQSIEKVEIEIDGFAALSGRSNLGKSAIIRAIQSALTGAPVASFVRHGPGCPKRTKAAKSCKCFCSVHIMAEGFDLLWEKGSEVNRYTFNGTVYDKVSQGCPDFLLPYVAPVKVGDKQELMQVAEQFSPIFLLDQTGTVVADVLSDVAQFDQINGAMRSVEKDRKEAASTRKVRESDVQGYQILLTKYDGIDDVVSRAEKVETDFQAIDQIQSKIKQLEQLDGKQQALQSGLAALRGITQVKIPSSIPVNDRLKAFDKVLKYYSKVAERAMAVRALSGVEGIAVPTLDATQMKSKTFDDLSRWTEKLYEFQRWFGQHKSAEITTVPAMPGFNEAVEHFALLSSMLQRHEAVTASVTALESEFSKAEQEETGANQEFDTLGLCPTCAQPIHPGSHVT